MSVVWMNESAAETVPDARDDPAAVSIEQFVPSAEELGVQQAVASVAETGVPHHVQVDLISSSRGSVAMFVSIYRLPDGPVLVLIENSYRATKPAEKDASRTRRR